MAKLTMQEEASAPSTPGIGKWVLYFKSGGLYIKDDAGNEIGPIAVGTTDHGALTGLSDDDHPQYTLKTSIHTLITGMQLIWNSATSLSVGTGSCFAENGNAINIASILTASSLSLSSSTWYHVYVYLSSGSPAVEVVTTAPTAWSGTAYSKTSDASRRYVGSVRTDGSGNVYRFEHNPITNQVFYVNNNVSATPFRVLSNGVATSATSVSLTGVIPITTKLPIGRFANSDTTHNVFIGVSTLTTSAFDAFFAASERRSIYFPVDSGQVIYYIYASAPSFGLNIDVNGYIYNR